MPAAALARRAACASLRAASPARAALQRRGRAGPRALPRELRDAAHAEADRDAAPHPLSTGVRDTACPISTG